jgi:TnpA family transposase
LFLLSWRIAPCEVLAGFDTRHDTSPSNFSHHPNSRIAPGGVTDHVFAVTSLLAFRFIPRIRDLPSKRLYLFDPATAPMELRGLIGGKIREGLIVQNWPDILRAVATMAAGIMRPSQLLKKFAAYPRQHELALALREIGRIERTLFIIDWLLDADMQRRAQIGLNKGEVLISTQK